MKNELIIKIKVGKISIDEHYYSFPYSVKIGSKKWEKDIHESDYDSMGMTAMKKLLENGYALELVGEKISDFFE